ncbi:AraC family transcriptional regulator [Acidovorax sp. D2M1]|uniref:AraC family transcriptional regulator n=1 Tax=Acidovorax benzenivorans TaxID=2987520 RepID=A0ABT5RW83_9BURK|nr:AraC family transcriptional regulator [Acidovorax benzenivorans]MDD2177959.1 AraC family transcriptional regulator [Acidovorax benzenivorans]
MENSKILTKSSSPRKMDRLAAFLDYFKLSVLVLDPEQPVQGPSLWLYEPSQGGGRIALRMAPLSQLPANLRAIVAIEFENAANPLMAAIPDEISVALDDAPALRATTQAFLSEVESNRCGKLAALDRLAEVMVLMMLRQVIDAGDRQPGLFAALAHPNLHRALVSMHDHPAKAWTVERLAEAAAMSRTQFMTTFRRIVGTTPMGYLGAWRLTLACRQLKAGDSVKAVARRVGFSSAEGFSRAYSRAYGHSPKARRD